MVNRPKDPEKMNPGAAVLINYRKNLTLVEKILK